MGDQSQTQNSSIGDTEIDLSELFVALWRGKFLIMLFINFEDTNDGVPPPKYIEQNFLF